MLACIIADCDVQHHDHTNVAGSDIIRVLEVNVLNLGKLLERVVPIFVSTLIVDGCEHGCNNCLYNVLLSK